MNTEINTETPQSPAAQTETLVAPAPQLDEALPEVDAGSIVEEAEQMLRESAPHDYEVLVIGAGPGGVVAAIRAAQLGARVGLVEERELGGVCLNRGCIPTKTLLESIDVARLMRRAKEYGIALNGGFTLDFDAMHARKTAVVSALRENVAGLLEENGVKVLCGRARFVGEHEIEIIESGGDTQRVKAVHVVIATGGLPSRLPIPGADLPNVVTSDELLESADVPKRFVVVGAGAVGVEFAYLYHELGAQVSILEASSNVLPQEDADIAAEMERLLREYGLNLVMRAKLKSIELKDGALQLNYSDESGAQSILCDRVLFATGRRANTDGLDLDAAGIVHEKGRVEVDEDCQTNVSGVYAIGDCVRDVGWAHQAAGEGTLVAEAIMEHPRTVDLRHLPSCYYTHPEIAGVGQTREDAEAAGIETRAGTFYFRSNGKAAAAGEHDGFVKMVIEAESEKIIGCQIIGPRATELINQAVLALKTNQTIDEFVGAIHAHPTFSEALPEAALAARKH